VTEETIGRPRQLIAALPAYRPGRGAKQAEQEHGITNAIKLASNENPDEPLDPIVAAVAAAAHGINRYPDHRATAVREAIAGRLGVGIDQVAIGTGSSGLLQQFVWAYVDPDDEVLYPWRSFEAYPIFTNLAGGRSITVGLHDDLAYDADGLVAAVTPRTKLLFLATPNNPTGIATSVRDLGAIIERIPPDVVVVIDEAYREFLDPAFGDPVDELVPRFPNVVVTRTFSKAHGLAGLRLGYAIGDPRVIATVDKTLLPFAVNSLAQVAALAAIEHEDAIAARVKGILAERARVEGELAGAGWKLPDHQGNFVWLRTGDATDAVGLALERRGVVVRPFSGDGVRVTIGTPAENDRFLRALAEVVAEGTVEV
jgi:histidinol-phosphate aminotransferase